jgi:hypothetical protein
MNRPIVVRKNPKEEFREESEKVNRPIVVPHRQKGAQGQNQKSKISKTVVANDPIVNEQGHEWSNQAAGRGRECPFLAGNGKQ